MSESSLLKKLGSSRRQYSKMPVVFVGHGSPMNGILQNSFSDTWATLAKKYPMPEAIVVVSAHWFTRGTRITAMDNPPTIHDFYGFPKALSEVQYPAPGNPILAEEIRQMVKTSQVVPDHDWGLDHGTWTVLRHFYPQAQIPVLQLSLDYTKAAKYHYELAQELTALRSKGVLIVGSGNMVHNLRMINWDMMDGGGYDWAISANETFKRHLINGNHQALVNYEQLGADVAQAIPTAEHYLPLLYTLALQANDEEPILFNDEVLGGSLTMTSVAFGL